MIQAGPGVNPPALLHLVHPEYLKIYRRLSLEGLIHASRLEDENGNVSKIRFHSGHQVFSKTFRKTLRKAKFKPASKDGTRAKMWMKPALNFEA